MSLDDIRSRAVITVTDCARLLGMDERSVRRGIEEGDLPGVKVGRRTLVPVPRLLALLEATPHSWYVAQWDDGGGFTQCSPQRWGRVEDADEEWRALVAQFSHPHRLIVVGEATVTVFRKPRQ